MMINATISNKALRSDTENSRRKPDDMSKCASAAQETPTHKNFDGETNTRKLAYDLGGRL